MYLSRAYRLERGSCWQIDPGILHAPGSLLTYEPQVNSDVFAMFQSEVEGRITPWDLLVKDVPPDQAHDLDYIIGDDRLGREREPAFRREQPLLPETGEAVRGNRAGRLSRAVGDVRHVVVLRQGADGAAEADRHDQGCRGLRADPDAGARHVRPPAGLDAGDDPLRPDDGRRTVRDGGGGGRRRPHREPQRDRSAGHSETLRARQSRGPEESQQPRSPAARPVQVGS